ncbi:MAG: NUDIX domain-containing protein [Candidatus Hodarchaeales archaeon]
MVSYEKKIAEKIQIRGRFMGVRVDDVELPSGTTEERIWVDFPAVCIIVPFINPETVILVRQYRYAIQSLTYELPAGKIDEGEIVSLAAQRELLEETGYMANIVSPLFKLNSAPHYSNEIWWICLAHALKREKDTKLDSDEIYDYKEMPLSLALEMIENGSIIDGKSIMALFYLYYAGYIDNNQLLKTM